MRILDRQRYWAFFKAYTICFVSFIGLYVVIDAFSNFDEFLNITRDSSRLFQIIGRYYLIRSIAMYDRLCGVITMMAAVFTVTWMQRDNELIAMLAAGISTQRVIRPVLIASVLVNLMAVANQELLIPKHADELQKSHADDGKKNLILLTHRRDINDIVIQGREGERRHQVITNFTALLSRPIQVQIDARRARYIAEGDTTAPLRGGWLLRDTRISPPGAEVDSRLLTPLTPEDLAQWPRTQAEGKGPEGAAYFFRTNVDFESLTRRRDWYMFGSTVDLFRALRDPINNSEERKDIEIFLHTRLIRPFLAMALLMVTLPLVLGGVGRNTFANLGMSLGTSAGFYACGFLALYLASNDVFAPEIAAWGPLTLFSVLAVARWDTIRS